MSKLMTTSEIIILLNFFDEENIIIEEISLRDKENF